VAAVQAVLRRQFRLADRPPGQKVALPAVVDAAVEIGGGAPDAALRGASAGGAEPRGYLLPGVVGGCAGGTHRLPVDDVDVAVLAGPHREVAHRAAGVGEIR